jgi:hypothetical protein
MDCVFTYSVAGPHKQICLETDHQQHLCQEKAAEPKVLISDNDETVEVTVEVTASGARHTRWTYK